MKSYTALRNLYATLTENNSSGNLTDGDEFINDDYRRILSVRPWYFRQKSKTMSTVAAQQFYDLPADCEKTLNIYVTIGTTRYTPRECPSRELWDRINYTTNQQSDIPEYFFIFNGQFGFFPVPSSTTASAITINYQRKVPDLSAADYTTGTITTATNASTAIVGSGSSWTAGMAGFYLRITRAAAASKGDGIWYEIDTIDSSTTLTLASSSGYLGTSIAAGAAAYTIGQMPILPEDYHDLPVYGAAAIYWSKEGEAGRAKAMKELANEKLIQLIQDHSNRSVSVSVDMLRNRPMTNPNNFLTYS